MPRQYSAIIVSVDVLKTKETYTQLKEKAALLREMADDIRPSKDTEKAAQKTFAQDNPRPMNALTPRYAKALKCEEKARTVTKEAKSSISLEIKQNELSNAHNSSLVGLMRDLYLDTLKETEGFEGLREKDFTFYLVREDLDKGPPNIYWGSDENVKSFDLSAPPLPQWQKGAQAQPTQCDVGSVLYGMAHFKLYAIPSKIEQRKKAALLACLASHHHDKVAHYLEALSPPDRILHMPGIKTLTPDFWDEPAYPETQHSLMQNTEDEQDKHGLPSSPRSSTNYP